MKKRLLSLILLTFLAACMHIAPALGAGYGTAIIDGRDADRVHLREFLSADSKSLGLYFTGTEVLCESDPNQEWVAVTIGRQSGYMKSEYLRWGSDPSGVSSRQPIAVVQNKTDAWINLREAPSVQAARAGILQNGDAVTVLGETVGHWCYVRSGDRYGYVMADFLSFSDSASFGAASLQGYEMLYYMQAPNIKSAICIQYPHFLGAGFDPLNRVIYDKVQRLAQVDPTLYSGDTSMTIDYQAAVTLQNAKIVSVVFWGFSDIEGSAHPFTDLIAINVDLSSMREVALADLYTTDAGFERVFFEKAFFPTNPITSYEAALFPEMLRLQTPEYSSVSPFSVPGSVSYFLKPDGIVLSMPAVHATGSDHFEAQLSYSDIAPFYRLWQTYWEN